MSEIIARILLVDDEKHLLKSLRDYLVHEHFDVILAQSGEEALTVLEKGPQPDLIVLDISMPGMGGTGFLRCISSTDGVPSHPVLVLTARSTMQSFFDDIAVDGFLAKPCEEAVLLRKIREILAARKAAAQKTVRSVMKILLAEDDEVVAKEIMRIAAQAGYEIELVCSGPEVLEKSTGSKPDLILLKEILPRLNGSAAAALIDVMPSVKSIPVIIYDETAKEDDISPRASRLKCVKKYLKTSDADILIRAVAAILV